MGSAKTNDKSFLSLVKALGTKQMFVVFLLGFASGLPIMLLYSTIKIWLRREGIDLSTIGYFSWLTLPYTFKFLWSFLPDRYHLSGLGRRRSWLLLTQLGLIVALCGLGVTQPQQSMVLVAVFGFLLCFMSATQDIVFDAYRREILPENQLGIGASIGVYGYRIAMFIASGVGLWMVDPQTFDLTFQQMFFVMAGFMGLGIVATLWAEEPKVMAREPQTLRAAVVDPFVEFFKRKEALYVLAFIVLYKFGDAIGGSMLSTFYVDTGFDNKTIAEVTKGVGLISSMLGLFIGGWVLYRLPMKTALMTFGILQGLSTAFISILSHSGTNVGALTAVVAFEDLSSGMGTAAFVAFLGAISNVSFTATQFALFSSLASAGRTFFSGFAGKWIEVTGYEYFFISCALMAIPGLLLIPKLSVNVPKSTDKPAETPEV
ncbi:MAG TPA: AmpG family muropeptide MFS transporter [Bdellovibrionota bacterium]|jgi:PAT family beta-lactamase induction signal transducer AmpG|nr:AmpG family muropeptide MFS transporter [Bdellovibrionota bacterium]